MNELFKIQFKYCPIIWMFYSRPSSNKINGLFKCCQRKIYNNERSNFGQRLNKNFCSNHHKNIHALVIEI